MSSDNPLPITMTLERAGAGRLRIVWSDGERRMYRAAELRKACPCATCREKRSAAAEEPDNKPRGLPILKAAEAKPLEVVSMSPVGNYAYNIAFSDEHDSGLFTFEFLRTLGQIETLTPP
jgi:DUF971 family protein